MLVLREEQQEVKSKIYHEINNGRTRVAVQAMTSFGKTALAASIALDALKNRVAVVFTAPLVTLVEQTYDEFVKFGIDPSQIGIIQANHELQNFAKPVQICSIQSIAALYKQDLVAWVNFFKDKLIIHDETHIWHETHKIMNDAAERPVIGLSATPWRKGLGLYYDTLVSGPDTRTLISMGSLCDYVAYSHHQPDMSGVSISQGDYSLKESGEKYDQEIIGNIVKTWEKHAVGRKTILFAPRVVDAERFASEFRAAGYRAVSVSGYMDAKECKGEIERFRNGEIDVICSVAKLATGFSVKDVGCIIDAQPTKSLMRHIQKIGRGLRTHPDKENVIILDNAGNLLRNGLPDDTYPTMLDDGKENQVSDKREQDEPKPKECPSCKFVKPPKTPVCPSCGFKAEIKSELEVTDGELVQIGKKANRKFTIAEKQEFIGGLKTYAYLHGYSDGWVAHTYKEFFSVWPNHPEIRHAPRTEINEATEKFIKYKQLRYHKGREKANKQA